MLDYFAPLICGAASGLALFLSGPPKRWWPLQLCALLPWLLALCASTQLTSALLAGAGFATCYLLPLLRTLKMPVLLGLGMGVWQSFMWLGLSVTGFLLLRSTEVASALAFACLATIVCWLDYTLLPMFGSATCFTRPLSKAPRLIQFAQLVGVPGIVWVSVAGQALIAHGIFHRQPLAFALLLPIWGLPLLFNEWSWRRKSSGEIKVAAVGWVDQWDPIALMKGPYREYLETARNAGAQLLVSPETAFQFQQREEWFRIFSRLARQHKMALAVGYFDQSNMDNRILFMCNEGECRGEYRKTHLVPFFENYTRGDGALVQSNLDGWTLGGVICQDDNFTDLTRAYGRANTHILAVPTNDWRAVKDFHFENSVFRAIEGRVAMVRAASNGVSAIISPRGEVLRRLDHYQGGAGLIVANVSVYSGVTMYSRLGDWWIAVCAAGTVAWFLMR